MASHKQHVVELGDNVQLDSIHHPECILAGKNVAETVMRPFHSLCREYFIIFFCFNDQPMLRRVRKAIRKEMASTEKRTMELMITLQHYWTGYKSKILSGESDEAKYWDKELGVNLLWCNDKLLEYYKLPVDQVQALRKRGVELAAAGVNKEHLNNFSDCAPKRVREIEVASQEAQKDVLAEKAPVNQVAEAQQSEEAQADKIDDHQAKKQRIDETVATEQAPEEATPVIEEARKEVEEQVATEQQVVVMGAAEVVEETREQIAEASESAAVPAPAEETNNLQQHESQNAAVMSQEVEAAA